jgi:hypothetical protein
MTPTTDTPPKNPAFMLPAELAEWKAGQHPVDPHAEADASWSAVPVDSDSVTAGAGIPAEALAALIAATVPADEHLDDGGPIEYDVIDLDGPDPALTAWQELSACPDYIDHQGDASKMIPFPRPAWSDPDEDNIGDTLGACFYRSKRAKVTTSYNWGHSDGSVFYPAYASVSVRHFGTLATPLVTLTLVDQRKTGVGPGARGLDLHPSTARELAAVLLAAAALAESEVTR